MKRAFSSLMLVVAMLALSACSSVDDFVVINRSDVSIEVVYTFKRLESGGDNVQLPRVMDAAKLEKTNQHWETVPSEQYVFDSQAGRIAIRLAPGKALLLTSIGNYREDSEGAEQRFGIASLSIKGAKGTIRVDGHQARMLFRKEERCHVIAYE